MSSSAEADVLIVGAGASGAAAAWRLGIAGRRVVCLEQGDWVDAEDRPAADPRWELLRQREWHPNPNVRRGPADYPVNDTESPIRPLLFNGVGGSTVMWSCHLPRFHPSDFRMFTQDGVGADWPLDYEELAPFYDLNERMMGTAGLAGDPAYPPRPARQTPPAPVSTVERRLTDVFDRRGWHWWPGDLAINTAAYDGRGACTHCGPCELGCVHDAKGATQSTYWPKAIAAGVRLITGARVFEITVDAQGRATGAAYYDREGRRQHQKAAVVILAANGIGTPRLMLLSQSGRFPNGIANGSGLVGRKLMLHPLARVSGRFPGDFERWDGYRGLTAGALVSHEFYETDLSRGFTRGFKLQFFRSHGPALVAGGSVFPRMPWGKDHHARFDAVFGRTAGLSICVDDLPEIDNRITLDPALSDSDGIPAPKMHYVVGDNSRRILDYAIARCQEALTEAGAVELFTAPLVADAGFHLMGTAGMGDDPETSVTDRWGRTHEVPNLYVVDGSVFVTAASVNPTHTLQALALRTAAHLVGE